MYHELLLVFRYIVCLHADFVVGDHLSIGDDVTVTSLAVVPVSNFLNSSTILALCAGA